MHCSIVANRLLHIRTRHRPFQAVQLFVVPKLSCLVQCEDMPDELLNARIDRKMFNAAQLMVGKYHRIGFPLRYWQNTKHAVDARSMRRLVEGVCKTNLPDVRVLL